MVCATLVIEVRGGFVQRVIADRNIRVMVLDHDMKEGPGLMTAEVNTEMVKGFERDFNRQQHLPGQLKER
jgi:hypothetical protein